MQTIELPPVGARVEIRMTLADGAEVNWTGTIDGYYTSYKQNNVLALVCPIGGMDLHLADRYIGIAGAIPCDLSVVFPL